MSRSSFDPQLTENVRLFARQIVDRDFQGNLRGAVSSKSVKRIGLSHQHLSDVLAGKKIGLLVVLALATYENVSVDEVLGRIPRWPNLEEIVGAWRSEFSAGVIAFARRYPTKVDLPKKAWMRILMDAQLMEMALRADEKKGLLERPVGEPLQETVIAQPVSAPVTPIRENPPKRAPRRRAAQ